jgi:DNA-directed RNA polymerase subunit RPC12/RpoP
MEMLRKVFRKQTGMRPTLIIVCSRCGGLLLATDGQKTRTCPYCGTRIDIRKAKKVASAKSAFEASEMLRKLKSRKSSSCE